MSIESAFVNIGTGFSSLDILQKSGVREDQLKGIRDLQVKGKKRNKNFILVILLVLTLAYRLSAQ